ncbi:MAG: DUF1275 family protein [Solirubrobacterales bacterium]
MSVLGEAAQTLSPPRRDRHGPLTPMMVALTFVTSLVDAASYVKLGHVFVANMTGNVASEAGLARGSGSKGGRRIVAVGAMLLGALAGGLPALNVSVAAALAVALGIVLTAGFIIRVLSRHDAAWARA